MANHPRMRDDFLFWLVIAIIGIACLGISSLKANGQETTNLRPYYAVGEVVMEGGRGFGTCTLIRKCDGNGMVLCASHVLVHPGAHIRVKWLGTGGESDGICVKLLPATGHWNDMGVAIVENVPDSVTPVKVVRFSADNAPFYSAGYRDEQLRVGGPYTDIQKLPNGEIKINEPLTHGMSGGALFDKYGRLCGIVIASNTSEWQTDGYVKYGWGIFSDGESLESLLRPYGFDF